MGPRRWIALASIALFVVIVFFALHSNYSATDSAPGRAASQETTGTIPSNPDTANPNAVAPKQP